MNVNKLNDIRRFFISYRTYCKRLNESRIADFPNTYEAKVREEYWNDIWLKNNYWNPKNDNYQLKMLLPPPNVTGVLHLGHALTVTVEDILARWHRMKGDAVLWVPGLDHAGIATQVAVEKNLFATKGVTRHDLGREKFLKCVDEWKQDKGDAIKNQLKSLGATLDWSREYFTMSKEHNKAVVEAFVTLHQRNLLYRHKDLVNWSPTLRSTISDIEVDVIEVNKKTDLKIPGYDKSVRFGEIAEVVFKLKDCEDEITVATTRVESMFGDVAIAVHPDDSRYSRHIGRQVWHPLRETFVPIIADSSVRQDFGTGAVKITPGHHHQDLDIARRHSLEIIEVIKEDGRMNDQAKNYSGVQRFEARRKITDELTDRGIIRDIKDHAMTIPVCSRSGDVIEYMMKEQWFMSMKKMAQRAMEAVTSQELKLDPPGFEETWLDCLDNIKDWCVSRQLWWGHRIPAYRCFDGSKTHWIVAPSLQEARELAQKQFGVTEVQQDEDVLDTWFSAGLLPLSAMGWPDKKYAQHYPLSLMETGHDILMFWVSRMVMMCTELVGTLPYNEVLLHGILCDAQGKKMSKSLGNVILPEYIINGISLKDLNAKAEESFAGGILSKSELKRTLAVNNKMFSEGIAKCGVDALRLTLCAHNIKNEKISFNVIECKTNSHFCNKIWQACKYVLLVTDDSLIEKPDDLTTVDRWILSRLALMVETVNESFEQRNFYKAIRAFRQFFYYEFCDFFIEATKPGLQNSKENIILSHRFCLIRCLEVSLRAISPVMPFLCDELYSRLAAKLPAFTPTPSVMKLSYPTVEEFDRDCKLEEKFSRVLKIIFDVRNIYAYVNKSSILGVEIVTEGDNLELFKDNINVIVATTRVSDTKILPADNYVVKENSICSKESDYKLYFLLKDNKVGVQMTDKVQNKKLKLEEKINKLTANLSRPKFIPDEQKTRIEDQIKNLKHELEKIPRFV
ncbi:valine--tRNA ligase, mitochondrial-like [Microplitis mediator]|uniref:valine--tRNA ligase, mitochondrial-like n=1 Tax=Microplitis mediator TaxID=375433 RepID=UPI002553C59C|nr:valine--tRNA ligase, mitochondrial-like [Microplitis mediator]